MSRPDRFISPALETYIFVGGWMRLLWIATALAVIPIAFLLMPPSASYFEPSYDSRANGHVVKVEEAGIEIFNEKVIEVEAQFRDADLNPHVVRSYTSKTRPVVDAYVTVFYVQAHPDTAVIGGMRTHAIPWWLPPAVVVFCVVMAAGAVAIGLRRRLRALALLRRGTPATGTIVEVREHDTGDGIVWIPVFELTTPDKRTQRFEGDSTGKRAEYRVGMNEAIVYDPESPANVTLLRDVPGKPIIDGDHIRFG